MLSVILYPEADAAIEHILTYTAKQHGLQQAERYIEYIKASIRHLCGFPHSGKAYGPTLEDMRVYQAQRHVIVYRVLNNELHIITFLHHAMNIAARLQAIAERLPL